MAKALSQYFRAAVLCGTAALFTMSGCVTEARNNAKVPDKQPDWVTPARMLVAMQLPADTDANGYLDTIPLTVYLFDERYPLAISVPGSFSFKLKTTAGKELGTWTIDEPTATNAIRKMRPGPGYQFRLDVRKFGPDGRDSGTVDLTAEFVPSSGAPVHGTAATTFRLGRAGV